MLTLEKLFAKLGKIEVIKATEDSVVGTIEGSEVEVNMNIRKNTWHGGSLPALSANISVFINGGLAINYGADSEKSNLEILKWFSKKETEYQKSRMGLDKKAKDLFNSF